LSLFETKGFEERCKEASGTCRISKYLKVNIKDVKKVLEYAKQGKALKNSFKRVVI
jgi:hypothetical protein